MKLAYDLRTCKVGCVLLQAVMGGDHGLANQFDVKDWETGYSPTMRLYEVTPEQFEKLLRMHNDQR